MAEERSLKDLAESLKNINDGGSIKEIESHAKVSRRHLLESKKTLFAINSTVSSLVNFSTNEERQREQKAFNADLLAALENSDKPSGGVIPAASGSTQSGGSMFEGLGSFVSSLPGALLGSFAKGLTSFANPMVILGAAGLGVAITLIGAGIAGATWLVGKSLPTFAEGLAHFETLDGKVLGEVGDGVYSLGKGLAVFGVGGAAAGIGNIIGNLAEGITNFFGGKTPIDKLQEFSKLDIDTAKVKNNSEAVVAYSKAMVALGAGGLGSAFASFGNLASNLFDGLSSFFGKGQLPLDKIMHFASYDLPTEKIKQNSEAVGAYAIAMSKLAGAGLGNAGASLLNLASNVLDSLAFFAGSGDLPMDKLMKFSSYDLPTEKIKQNSEAVGAYAIAMAKLAGAGLGGTGASLLNLVTNVSDSLALFAGDLPLDKIMKFASYDLPTEKIRNNSEAIGAYAIAMSKLAGGQLAGAGGSLGNLVSNLADGLVALFGGSKGLPLDELNEFAKAEIDVVGIQKNAEALGSFVTAISGLSVLKNLSDLKYTFNIHLVNTLKAASQLDFSKMNLDNLKSNIPVIAAAAEAFTKFASIKSNEISNVANEINKLSIQLRRLPSDVKINIKTSGFELNTMSSEAANSNMQAQQQSQQSSLVMPVVNNAANNSTAVTNVVQQPATRTSMYMGSFSYAR